MHARAGHDRPSCGLSRVVHRAATRRQGSRNFVSPRRCGVAVILSRAGAGAGRGRAGEHGAEHRTAIIRQRPPGPRAGASAHARPRFAAAAAGGSAHGTRPRRARAAWKRRSHSFAAEGVWSSTSGSVARGRYAVQGHKRAWRSTLLCRRAVVTGRRPRPRATTTHPRAKRRVCLLLWPI